MKPIREWLKELPQDIQDMFNAYEGTEVQLSSFDTLSPSLKASVHGGLKIEKTKEGTAFWCYVAEELYGKARLLLRPPQKESVVTTMRSVDIERESIRGFIELTLISTGEKSLINVDYIMQVDVLPNGCSITFNNYINEFQESYDTVKQLIKEATL